VARKCGFVYVSSYYVKTVKKLDCNRYVQFTRWSTGSRLRCKRSWFRFQVLARICMFISCLLLLFLLLRFYFSTITLFTAFETKFPIKTDWCVNALGEAILQLLVLNLLNKRGHRKEDMQTPVYHGQMFFEILHWTGNLQWRLLFI